MAPQPETVLVTGASSGIGLELATLFARDRARLVLVARDERRLEALARGLEERQQVTVHVLPFDLSRSDAPARIDAALRERALQVDVLVNNAGFGERGPVAALDLERQLQMVQVNLTAVTHLTRLLLPGLIERRRGGVLNVASTAAFQPGPNMAVYYATKAYVLSFSEALSEELAGTGVTVTCLAPGPTSTEFARRANMLGTRLFSRGTPMSAARAALAGYDGFRSGKVLVIPGFSNRLGTFAVRLAPRAFVRKLVAGLNA